MRQVLVRLLKHLRASIKCETLFPIVMEKIEGLSIAQRHICQCEEHYRTCSELAPEWDGAPDG